MRGDFFWRNASIGLASFAGENCGIEIATERIGDHAISHAVLRVALLHQGIHKELAIAIAEELVDLGLPDASFGAAWL